MRMVAKWSINFWLRFNIPFGALTGKSPKSALIIQLLMEDRQLMFLLHWHPNHKAQISFVLN
jgi:hypothetical protein